MLISTTLASTRRFDVPRLKRRLCLVRTLLPFVALCLIVVFAIAAPAKAQEPDAAAGATGPGSVVRGTFGAWQLSCRTPPGAREEKCALVQSVTAEDRPNVGLTVVFYKAIGEDKKLLRVVVPHPLLRRSRSRNHSVEPQPERGARGGGPSVVRSSVHGFSGRGCY